jgi:hypothetical protein
MTTSDRPAAHRMRYPCHHDGLDWLFGDTETYIECLDSILASEWSERLRWQHENGLPLIAGHCDMCDQKLEEAMVSAGRLTRQFECTHSDTDMRGGFRLRNTAGQIVVDTPDELFCYECGMTNPPSGG